MAKKNISVWGIDIGQCALKALRCTLDNGEVVADAFDYIEYPRMLSQPEADPRQLVQEALAQFLSRNDVKEGKVAISVPGQMGLTKFFKPPPMDQKRVADIVKYEARQQIPFSLDEVVWDFQQMAGSQVDEDLGLLIESEIGLFAMKRDQVYRAMRPFDDTDVELDIIQLAPLCVYNFVSYDILSEGPSEDEFDPDNPPESLVVLAMGTDTTDLVVTNGFRLWQRSVPVGGNHFTKQLTRSLKLTFAKAEHIKRNAREAEDPKKVFQAMRPVFNDLVTEVQRSVGYFQGIDRKAKITGVVLLGNAVKLPGLQQFLAKNLGYKIIDFKGFSHLQGSSVLTSPAFKDNAPAFAVCYGLCLQGLGKAKLSTNLVPREILNNRLVRAKKPWALAAVGALLLACSFNFLFQYRSWHNVQPDRALAGVQWQAVEQAAEAKVRESGELKSRDTKQVAQLEHLKAIGAEVGGNAERRLLWLELLKALNEALPRDPGNPDPFIAPSGVQKPFAERKDVHVESVESEYFPELSAWYTPAVRQRHLEAVRARATLLGGTADTSAGPAAPQAPAEAGAGSVAAAPAAEDPGPRGPGWVIELRGYHFFNQDLVRGRATYVRTVVLGNIENSQVELPVSPGKTEKFSMKELGIGYAILASDLALETKFRIPNPDYQGPRRTPSGQEAAGAPAIGTAAKGAPATGAPAKGAPATGAPAKGAPAGAAGDSKQPPAAAPEADNPPYFVAPKYTFIVQFCWQERLLSDRLKARLQATQQQGTGPESGGPKDQSKPKQGDIAGM